MRRIFPVCLAAYAASQMELALFGYALPEIRREWRLDLAVLGDSVAVAFVLGGLALPVLGSLTDRFGRKRLLLLACVASPLLVASLGLARGIVALTLLRAAAIAAGGLSYPVTGALVAESAPARYRGIYTGLLQVGYPLGWFVGSLLAGALLAPYGWRVLFALALLGLPIALVVARWLPESSRFERGPARPSARWRELLTPAMAGRTVTLFGAQFLFVIAYGGTSILFPLYFREARGFDLATSTRLVGLGNAIAIIGYVGAAITGEFWMTRRNTVVVWTLAGGLAFLWLVWGTTTPAESLAAFGLMAVFFYGAAAVKFAYIAEVFPTHLRATGLAVCGSLAVTLGTAVGPPLITRMAKTAGWDFAFSLFGALPLLLAALLYLALKPLPSGLELEEVQRRLARRPGRA